MKAVVFPANERAGGFYRILEPARCLVEQNLATIEVDVAAKQIGTHLLGGYDVAVFQHPMTRMAVDWIQRYNRAGIATVVELDDDFWSIDKRSVAFKGSHETFSPHNNRQFLKQCLRTATLITVSTPALREQVHRVTGQRGKPVVVLRNCVPKWYLDVEADPGDGEEFVDGRKIVGWAGNPDWHAGDLAVCGDGVRRATRDNGAVFVCLGSPNSGRELGFDDGESLYSPLVELSIYPAAVANYAVGLAPLRECAFNESKSYLKGLEYAALGIPFVASPVAEYRYLAHAGVGDIANHKHDWYRCVNRLLSDAEYAQQRTSEGKRYAALHTYERNSSQWLDAWQWARDVKEGK